MDKALCITTCKLPVLDACALLFAVRAHDSAPCCCTIVNAGITICDALVSWGLPQLDFAADA
jgi:hypothetical protein